MNCSPISALKTGVEVAKRCNVTVRLGEYFRRTPTEGLTIEDFLIKNQEGLGRDV
ncbi:hypothetical protein OH492_05660 [Vibrio chagasii]|nr:hypothetical protein [Vibrio chagasii]